MLYIISTPIGNLGDITYRAVECLSRVDYILCEDTRRSKILLSHYGIEKLLKSFHLFSESKGEDEIIAHLKQGKEIALISDAGTPTIADPGQRLIHRCRKEGVACTSLPGPSAPILALVLSGFSTERFQFLGFLPRKEGERRSLLLEALLYSGISLFFESPNRIQETLRQIETMGPCHQIAIVREMTKIHEECLRGTASELMSKSIRGEIVLLIEGKRPTSIDLSPREHVEALQRDYGMSKKEAIQLAAQLRDVPKKYIYSCLISPQEL